MGHVTIFSELLCSLQCKAKQSAPTLRSYASWECFCDKSIFEHAPLNLYLVDPCNIFLSFSDVIHWGRQMYSPFVWAQTTQSTCLAGWHLVECLSSFYFLWQFSLSVSIMSWELSVGVSLVFVRLSCMFSLNMVDISTVSQERVLMLDCFQPQINPDGHLGNWITIG